MSNAIDLKEIVNITIGPESLYVLEKSGTAIYKDNRHDIDFAKTLLLSFKKSYLELQKQIKVLEFYDRGHLDYDFRTLFYAIDKLYHLLGSAASEEDELQASIYHSHIYGQNKRIRQSIAEQD